ncbi:MAG: hypothetical protein N2378_07630 [Chloroflexaceae bacterium]|nr:hypothetical protein [Chloroflexaceae bacterium]
MFEEQERHGRREEGNQAATEDTAAPEPVTRPADEAPPATPATPATLRPPQRPTVWRWHVRRRRRRK